MKRRFAFRLARVLRVRSIAERVARSAFADAQARLLAAERVADTARQATDRTAEDVRRSLERRPLNPRAVLLEQRSLDAHASALGRSEEVVQTARLQAERLGEAWRGREIDRRVLDELERRSRERHRRALERHEEHQQDELTLARRVRPGGKALREAETDSSPRGRPVDESDPAPSFPGSR